MPVTPWLFSLCLWGHKASKMKLQYSQSHVEYLARLFRCAAFWHKIVEWNPVTPQSLMEVHSIVNWADFPEHVAHATDRHWPGSRKRIVRKPTPQQSGKKKVQGAVIGAPEGAPVSIPVTHVVCLWWWGNLSAGGVEEDSEEEKDQWKISLAWTKQSSIEEPKQTSRVTVMGVWAVWALPHPWVQTTNTVPATDSSTTLSTCQFMAESNCWLVGVSPEDPRGGNFSNMKPTWGTNTAGSAGWETHTNDGRLWCRLHLCRDPGHQSTPFCLDKFSRPQDSQRQSRRTGHYMWSLPLYRKRESFTGQIDEILTTVPSVTDVRPIQFGQPVEFKN